ncbi:MAG: uroporphyrinogen decarboxylase family protein [Eubacteriales bacterium]
MNKGKIYEERLSRIIKAANVEEPDRVPIISTAQSFSVGYAGSTLHACMADEQEEYRVYDKTYTDFYWDGAIRYGTVRNMDFYGILGYNTYFESKEGTVLEHLDKTFMNDSDYPEFLKDPMSYLINVELARKYPSLSKTYPENKEALLNAAQNLLEYAARTERRMLHAKDDLELPVLENGVFLMPGIDFLFSYLRGFKGLADMRRRPDDVLKACQMITDIMLYPYVASQGESKDSFAFAPALFTPYLAREQFEKIVWPDYKKLIEEYHRLGGRTFLMMEGKWGHVYDLLIDLPKGSVVAHVEKDDIFDLKKKVGSKVCVAGGIDIYDLRYSSKQECIDKVKRVIDECAPGGGYMFAPNQTLITKEDVNPDNLRAVNEFVKEYGVYK